MVLITLTSASGSPGVTTTAVAMALSWPRPVLLVEADPTGGSGVLAGFLRGTVAYEAGLVELALSPLGVAEALRDATRPLGGNARFVAGTRSHQQVGVLRGLWAPLAEALTELQPTGQDVLVDAGRLGLAGAPGPLLEAADLALLVARTSLPAVAAARSWAQEVRRPDTGWAHPGALLIGDGHPYPKAQVAEALDLAVVAELPDDPAAAAVYHRGATPPRRFADGTYSRSVVAAVHAAQAAAAQQRPDLLEEAFR